MARITPLSSAFGKAIKQIRMKKGWTQEDLSDRSGLDRSYISRVERGLKNPSLNTIWDLANYLEVPLPDLLIETVQNLPLDLQKVKTT